MNLNSTTTADTDSGLPLDECAMGILEDESYNFVKNEIVWYVHTACTVLYVIGFVGNVISLLAFRKQAKFNKTYFHQLSIMLCDTFSIVINIVSIAGFSYFMVWENVAPKFVQSSWFLLQFFAQAYTVSRSMGATTLFVMIGASLDRVQALFQPTKYRLVGQKRRVIAILVCSITLGFFLNLLSFMSMKTVFDESNLYILYSDTDLLATTWGEVLSWCNLLFTVVGLLFLMIFGILVTVKYRRHKNSSVRPSNTNSNRADDGRSVDEKTLTVLFVCQLLLCIFANATNVCTNVIFEIVLNIPWCTAWMLIAYSVMDFSVCMQHSANFLIYIGVSKRFRQAVIAVMRCQELKEVTPGTQTGRMKSNRSGNATMGSRHGKRESVQSLKLVCWRLAVESLSTGFEIVSMSAIRFEIKNFEGFSAGVLSNPNGSFSRKAVVICFVCT